VHLRVIAAAISDDRLSKAATLGPSQPFAPRELTRDLLRNRPAAGEWLPVGGRRG